MTGPDPTPEQQPAPLFLVRGDATDQEVAALTVVLQALAAAAPAPPRRAWAQWSSPQRAVRSSYLSPGRPDGWRSSALPR
ncbi:acyl-CoA carboxylase epsilon subunit [Nocardioides mesophilus]|uniref:Acyl-CoA carboxylase subunit epsilon n=1 Tax=Nocardioides mesophilus TaxID=433659 RepID=A0A7G9RDJ2_9ACTN|nr:acyl-CoA carboxylase epsilon subunit [Nocardioides mesophilus]QNN53667.1 acyl-CoA carboxylase subunit epsilon [Nocardioides mesophilus]